MKNITELAQKKPKVKELSIEIEGEFYKFYMKTPMALERHILTEALGDMVGINQRREKAVENDEDYNLKGAEIAEMLKYKEKQVFILACDKNGNPLFESMDKMLRTYTAEIIDLMGSAIDEVTSKQGVKDAEKN